MTWVAVVGHDGYEVSDVGQVRSWLTSGKKRATTPRLLRQKPDKDDYLVVVLSAGGGRYLHRRVHRLVLEAFVGPCPAGMVCRHFPDRDPRNNRLENLQWGTPVENQADMLAHGTRLMGRRHHRASAKLTEDGVKQILDLLAAGRSQSEIGKMFGVGQQAISKISRRTRWSHLQKTA